MKKTTILESKRDAAALLTYARSLPAGVFTVDGTPVAGDNPMSLATSPRFCILPGEGEPVLRQDGRYTSVSEETDCAWFETTSCSGGIYIMGRVYLLKEDSLPAVTLYRELRRFLRAAYHVSFDKGFWVAPGMYKDWVERRVQFHFFVDAETIRIPDKTWEPAPFLARLSSRGYLVRENRQDIREKEDACAASADSYIIFPPNARLAFRIGARKRFYLPDSECVFLSKRRGEWMLLADSRHFSEGNAALQALFSAIEECCNKNVIATDK